MNKQISSRQLLLFPLFFVLYEMASYMSNDAYLPAMPLIKEQLQTTEDLVRSSLTSWFLGGCMVQLLVGPISDYIGRRKVMVAGGIVFVLSTLACALSTNIHILIWMRFIEGSTIATMAVSGYATIHALYDTKKSIQTIAFINSISVLAPALGPLAGALILQWYPWQTIFYVLAIWAIIPLALLQWDMPETAPVKQHSLNLKEILGRYKRIALNHRFMIYLIASRTLFSAMIVWLSAGPFLLYDTFKMDSLHFGYAQIFVFGAYIIGTRANSYLMDRYELHTILWQGWAFCLLGSSYSLIYALIGPNDFYPILPGLMFITFGSGISLPIYSRLAIEQSDEPMGAKVAMTTFSMTLFGVLATLSINVLFTNSLLSLALIMGSFTLSGFILFSLSSYMKWID